MLEIRWLFWGGGGEGGVYKRYITDVSLYIWHACLLDTNYNQISFFICLLYGLMNTPGWILTFIILALYMYISISQSTKFNTDHITLWVAL